MNSDTQLLQDPSLSLTDKSTGPEPNATLVPDQDGIYTRIVWESDEKERIERFLSQSINNAIQDHEGVWGKRNENKRAYEGLSDKGEAITLPMCRSNTNQQHAWLVNTFFSRDPFLGVKPLGARKYTISVKNPESQQMEAKTVTATDEATGIRQLLNFKWTYRLPMRRVLTDWSMEGFQDGNLPALTKVIHDDTYYDRKVADRAQTTQDTGTKTADGRKIISITNSPKYRKHKGETVRIVTVPSEDFLKPFSASSIEDSPWVAQRCEEPVYETHRKLQLGKTHARGGYDFCLPDNETAPDDLFQSVLMGTEPVVNDPSKKASRSTKDANRQKELSPLDPVVTYEVFFRWPVMTAATPDVIEWTECTGYYHPKTKKLLCCWELNNWNGERPFVDYFMRPRPNSYSGTCTVEDIAPFQRYASQLFHLQVQNMVMRNVSVFFVRKGSSAATSLRGRRLRPGMIVEFDDPEDVNAKQLGTAIDGITQEIAFLRAGAQEMSLVTQYDSGTADLSRVAAASFSQQQDLAKMQPQMVYDNFGDAVGRLALKYLQMLIQYAPEQELPEFGETTDAIIANVLHLPQEMVMSGDFAIYPIATPKDETKEAESQRDLQLSQAIDKANDFLMQVFGVVSRPGVPPPYVILGLKAIQRSEKILEKLISHTRADYDDYVIPDSQLMELIQQMYVVMQQMQQQTQMMQQQQQQQASQQPVVKMSIAGKMTPEQEAEIMRQQGVAGQQPPPPPPPPQSSPGQPPAQEGNVNAPPQAQQQGPQPQLPPQGQQAGGPPTNLPQSAVPPQSVPQGGPPQFPVQ